MLLLKRPCAEYGAAGSNTCGAIFLCFKTLRIFYFIMFLSEEICYTLLGQKE